MNIIKEELIQQFREGNRQAGDDYYNANIGLVYIIAKKYKKMSIDEEEIMAIVNQAFAYSLKKADLKKSMFSTYFAIVANGMILRHFRDCERAIRTQRRDATSKKIIMCDSLDRVIFESEGADITLGSNVSVEDDYTGTFVEEALSKLDKKDREAFEIKLFHELSQKTNC